MSVVDVLMKKIRSQLAAPALVVVDKAYMKFEEGGYCIDGTVLLPGSLEKTDEIMKEIPISPVWAAADGRGIYCPPEAGQVVIVSFIGFNRAWPVVSGVYGNAYTPADGTDKQLVLTDGKGTKITFTGEGEIEITDINEMKVRLIGDGSFEITDDAGAAIKIHGDGKISIVNGSASIKVILENLFSLMAGLQMLDPISGPLPVFPSKVVEINTAKLDVAKILKE